MTLYGIPYQGSKTKIAPNIIGVLPNGKRFVDLFGGGFAMSHCARLSNKYDVVLYNEINPLLPPLITDALIGRYNYNRFKPEFITREEFYKRKDKDGYIRYIWSFGNSGKEYMFGSDLEPLKKEAHDFVVFGKPTTHFKSAEKWVTSKDIHKRRLQFCGYFRKNKKRFDIEQLERLERLEQLERCPRFDLQQLEQLERLQQLEQLEQLEQRVQISCGSYEKYEHEDGDIVYCDPPYEGTADYGDTFNHAAFYEWVATRPYQVWFSSYQGVKDFRLVWAKQLRSSLGAGNSSINYECLYTNR
jgi:site-specific DNA-adenine methylase